MRTTRRDYASGTTGKEQNCMAKVKKKKERKETTSLLTLSICLFAAKRSSLWHKQSSYFYFNICSEHAIS